MGFAPDMKPLEREATALAGIACYTDVLFPEEYRNNFFIGDVVACRVYRNSATYNGSSPVGKMEPAFLLSEDPWFRPVDIKLGPDRSEEHTSELQSLLRTSYAVFCSTKY